MTSRVTRKKQRDCQSSTYDFSSRNKIKVTNKYSNIDNNKKKNRNTSNNGNNDDNVRFLMTKALKIVIMEELVIIITITVIKV